jgi:hypothetical protein
MWNRLTLRIHKDVGSEANFSSSLKRVLLVEPTPCSFTCFRLVCRRLAVVLPSPGRCFRPRRAVVFASFCFVSVGEELFGETLVWAF